MIRISAFAWVPPFARGYVRDLPVRWALAEAHLPYVVTRIAHAEKDAAAYRAWQPFGQVPAFEENGLRLFESGAIVLHIAERSDVLLPAGAKARARTLAWLFAALNTVELAVRAHVENEVFEQDAAIQAARRPKVRQALSARLAPLAARLVEREWLEDRFSCADLMMATVLRNADDSDLVTDDPALAGYLARCMARPAFGRAMAAHLADFDPA